jgi:hypothetical protein
MVRRKKHDQATVSFHFLQREKRKKGKNVVTDPFTPTEFNQLCTSVEAQPWPDTSDREILSKLRDGSLVPFRDFHRVDDRLAHGRFSNAYTGHAFENSDHGKIAAESVNQRLFHYILYHSDDGRIFVGAQYLGHYGGYERLRYGLVKHLPASKGTRSYSFRRELNDKTSLTAKEVILSVTSKGRDDEDNRLTKKRVLVLKRDGKDDHEFSEAAREDLLPIMSEDLASKKDILRDYLVGKNLISADDDDLKDCVVVVDIDGKEERLHVIGESSFATKYPLSVPYNIDGHPQPEPTLTAMLKLLDREIIENLA